jgi:hypothetical protein
MSRAEIAATAMTRTLNAAMKAGGTTAIIAVQDGPMIVTRTGQSDVMTVELPVM